MTPQAQQFLDALRTLKDGDRVDVITKNKFGWQLSSFSDKSVVEAINHIQTVIGNQIDRKDQRVKEFYDSFFDRR